MTDDLKPFFEIVKQTENVDGSATFDIEITDEFIEIYKQVKKKKRATKKGLQEFLNEIILDMIDNIKDGKIELLEHKNPHDELFVSGSQ